MSFPDLRTFLDQLRRDGDLAVVDVPVDADQEAAEIHRRVIAGGGPALLFTRVKGASFPLVTNLFGTARRAERAFGTRPLALIKRLVHLAETLLPPTPAKLWGARDLAWELTRIGARRVGSGPVTDVIDRPAQLDRLPVITCWPEDGGPFVTLPLVYTGHPDGKGPNLGMYRLHVYDAQTTGMHWQIGKGGGFHYQIAERRGEALPVTVFLGGPPALILAAVAPLPENVPETMLASLIAGERLRTTSGPGPHGLLADAEFALIGEVPPRERRAEGPFGDHYGYYSLQHDYPVFHVRAVAHRRDAIYPATVVGKPRQEDFFIGDLLQELLSPLFPLVMPAVEDLWSYGETGYHSLGAAVVKQRYPREAMTSAFRILGRRAALAHEVPARHRSTGRPEGLPRHPRARARTHASGDGFVRVRQPLHGHARLHQPGGEQGLQGCVDGARRSCARAAAYVPTGCGPAARRHRRSRLLRRMPRDRSRVLRERCRRCRPPGLPRRVCWLATGSAERRAAAFGRQPDELPVDHLHALRAGSRHPRGGAPRCAATTCPTAPRF